MRDHLQNQLQKAQQHKNKMADMLEKANKFLKNIQSEPRIKEAAIIKAQRKIKKAENGVQFAETEIERLNELVQKF